MSVVWERQDLDPYERLVMLSLADHADDDGHCYPSIARLCQRTGMKERGVQTVVKRLAARGLIVIEANAGRRGANLYTVRATGRWWTAILHSRCGPLPSLHSTSSCGQRATRTSLAWSCA